MFNFRRDYHQSAKLEALNKSFAVIEFDPAGNILSANELFLQALGYSLEEIVGKHHRMFIEPAEASTDAYLQFWKKLGAGEFQKAQYKRIGKGGREIWIEASYNPIVDRAGRVTSVVKYAIDVTEQKKVFADLNGQIKAINRSQAVIEFTLDGTVVDANENFLKTLGYRLDEIKGKHHSMFVDEATRKSSDYSRFWSTLAKGEYMSGQFKRIAKGGREVFIEASYNPVEDLNGKPVKVVKYASDVTRQVLLLRDLNQLIEGNFGEIEQALLQSQDRSSNAAAAASETTDKIQLIAASAEEMAASVGEIASSMARSRDATAAAAAQSAAADEATRRLSSAAAAMGGIVQLIQNIAGQINLLALNATIESARAGEAGRGFAVVANEVKNLANQAAKATEQISAEIDGIQSISGDVVQSLNSISTALDVMRDTVMASVSAVEEQSVVTSGMSTNMQEAAHAVQSISGDMNGIAAAVSQISGLVGSTQKAAAILAK